MVKPSGRKTTIHISTENMRVAIRRRWKAPEYAIMWEVGDATGGRHSRWADAMIMGLWPSRGIDLQGVEIKTYRSDWLRELKDPSKAEQMACFCDFWWIFASPDVVDPGELPKGWGLQVFNGKSWSTVVEAERRDAQPVSREFLAALLRRADQQVQKEAKRISDAALEEERSKIEARIAQRVSERARLSGALAAVAEEFEKATGLSIEEIARDGTASYAARMTAALMKQNLHNPWSGLEYLVKSLRQTADAASEAMENMGLTPPTIEECQRPKRKASSR